MFRNSTLMLYLSINNLIFSFISLEYVVDNQVGNKNPRKRERERERELVDFLGVLY